MAHAPSNPLAQGQCRDRKDRRASRLRMGSRLSKSLRARSRHAPGQVSKAGVTSRARPPRSHSRAKLSLDRPQMRKRVTRSLVFAFIEDLWGRPLFDTLLSGTISFSRVP